MSAGRKLQKGIMNMKKMNLANWMMVELLPMDMAAAKYTVGQDLTKEEAKDIIRIIANSVDFQLDNPAARKCLNLIGSPYRDFIVCITLLMVAGEPNPKWKTAIWGAMDANLRSACHHVIRGTMRGA